MRLKNLGLLILTLTLALLPAAAHAQGPSKEDGRLVEQSPFELPTYEQIPDRFKRLYAREAVERMRASQDLELLKIKYMSDGLKVAGFIYKPKDVGGKRLPAVIWNRGGVGEDTIISVANFLDLYEMHRYASEGFVVLASQYRGYDGGEGRDEVGGADTDDVLNLVALARSLGYVDAERVFMFGFSRGAQMTLQAIRRGAPLRAAVVVGAPTDMELSFRENPGIRDLARTNWAGGEARLAENMESRSAVRWAEQINVPLLIFQGGADPAVSPAHALELARRMDEAGNLYELAVYARDDHFVTRNAEERLSRTVEWFKNPRVNSISSPLRRTLRARGVEAAVGQYRELKKSQPGRYDFGEPELNALGYELLFTNRVKDAIEIFKLNVEMYPQAANTYDSLGEAYLAAGERALAAQNYRRSLELNPQNTNAAAALKRIEQQP
ncbi:MAG TPA: prolyl oligopeptidase family serine peptidase [Pyrinomonadaceae bacterium]|nr:prolyl oligopeptidase family serine peptidase [Pyrinomonadaceae bacterium]